MTNQLPRELKWADGDEGWVGGVEHCLSPNHDTRPTAGDVSLVVIHFISLPAGQFGGPEILALFQNRLGDFDSDELRALSSLRVSAHFLVRRDGAVIQCVPCTMRAWHAGRSSWLGRSRCNDFSIGIELEGAETCAFTDAQYTALNPLLALIRSRYPIRNIVGHEHIAPGRKFDPGPTFDWTRIACEK